MQHAFVERSYFERGCTWKWLRRRKPKYVERSGINGAGTSTQKAKGITDSGEIFLADTLKGGAKKPEIAKVTISGLSDCGLAHTD